MIDDNKESIRVLVSMREWYTYDTARSMALDLAIAALRYPATGAEAMREAAAKVAEIHAGECCTAGVMAENEIRTVALKIRALPLPAREVPERSTWAMSGDSDAVELSPRSRPGQAVGWSTLDGQSHYGILKEWDNGTAIIEEHINGGGRKEVAVRG